ncbi:serine protease snake-like [Ctenocephalides felis]|uniref:serine protease snake-like n=1 Tax=Ctenocephalides felis TaxID=7515 RepID=UPI000E6E4DB3|nr:serine protease snake-like [Ctenocephalides felis]
MNVNSNISYLLLLPLLFTIFSLGVSQRYEGDNCNLGTVSGKCRLIRDCPSAITALQNRGERPQICGFLETLPIVCCPSETSSSTSNQKPNSSQRPGSNQQNNQNAVSRPTQTSFGDGNVGSKARAMCRQYGEYIYEWITPPVQTFNSGKVKVNRCGHKATELVIGGELTKPREFPHMALLGMGDKNSKKWTCGGTLISDEFVLTAGHCIFSSQDGEVKWVRLGENNIQNSQETETQDFEVAQIIKHPQYKAPSRYNDIALLRLDRKAILNKYVIPACLHTEFNIGHQKAIATGWGRTHTYGTTSQQLYKVTLELFSQQECNDTYAAFISNRRLKYGIVPESQMCAGHHTESKDTCQGDSGGPLQTYLNDPTCMYDVIGITSFGIACGVVGSPGVYTRVSEYLPWIEQTVWG